MKHILTILTALLFAPLGGLSAVELTFASTFTDHAVLQRDAATPVWGLADPNENVTVAFGGQAKTTTADASGKWFVKLDPMPASAKGRELVARSIIKNREAKISDVVVGDVWLCSGQSNMALKLRGSENSEQEIATANHPEVRFFTVENQFAQRPAADVKGVWKPVSPATAGECSAVAYFFATALQPKLGVPVGLLVSASGGTRIETWMQTETLVTLGVSERLLNFWKNVSPEEFEKLAGTVTEEGPDLPDSTARSGRKKKGEKTDQPKQKRVQTCPSALFNGMIAPLQPYALCGMVWYQGENNSNQKDNPYDKLLTALIVDRRHTWGEELPFLFVQLPPFRNFPPEFRELQDTVWRKTPHTAMVVTTDVGSTENAHPRRKRPVGERLALTARAICYGEKVEYSGPVFKSLSVTDNRAVVSFSHVGQGLVAKGDALSGFVIAGADGNFVSAKAVIEGSTVVVTSDKVAQPVVVRYGWANMPDVNLFNRDGLPAAPFRSDLPANLNTAAKSE